MSDEKQVILKLKAAALAAAAELGAVKALKAIDEIRKVIDEELWKGPGSQ